MRPFLIGLGSLLVILIVSVITLKVSDNYVSIWLATVTAIWLMTIILISGEP
jgi:sulfite exporter TauE/SafE